VLDVPGKQPMRRLALNTDYADSIFGAGGEPMLLAPVMDGGDLPASLVGLCRGFVFSGGPDYPSAWYGEAPHPMTVPIDPARARFDLALMRHALGSGRPVLGICGGEELLNLALGGRLIQHLSQAETHCGDDCDALHPVCVCAGRLLCGIAGPGSIRVNSRHHQAIHPDGIGRGLMVSARAEDGTIEAVEGEDAARFLLGVQWHPERLPGESHSAQIFAALVEAAAHAGS
jgi:putative glutamine amidotransferase